MIRLDTTTTSLQAVLAGAISTNQPIATVCFSDDLASAATYTGGKQITALNSTTDVTILSAPAASTVRDIDNIQIHNRDTATVNVTVKFDVSGTDSTIIRATLLTLETLCFNHGDGWEVIDANGNIKTSTSGSPTGVAGGDLSGTYPNPTVAKINGATLGTTTATSGKLLIADGSAWQSVALSGDVTVNSAGVATIPAGSISLDELSDVVITSPATGATLIYDGVNWIDGQLDLADNDARTGTLPVANGGTGTTTATGTAGSVVLSVGPTITGTLTATGLIDISGASAGQIKFPATQNPSADANTLDDYEEGTWTPTIGGDTTAGTQTYSEQIGRYVKVGRLVTVECRIVMTAKDAATAGNLVIFGLPFTAASIASAAAGMATATTSNITLTALYTQIGLQTLPSTTTVFFIQNGSAQAAAVINSATGLAATSAIVMGGSYSV